MKDTFFLVVTIGFILSGNSQRLRPPRQGGQNTNTCTTPDGKPGNCFNIKQCPRLLDLLKSSRSNPETVEFLRRSMCGFDNNDPRVCCPRTEPNEPKPTGGNLNSNKQNPTNNFQPTAPTKTQKDDYPNLLSPPNCGHTDVSHSRIVGGSPSELGAWPWIAVLGYRSPQYPDDELQWKCGSTLISSKHIITAAHCTRHPTLDLIAARLGELDLNETIKDGAVPIEVNIQRALAHPEYDSTKFLNDIAILFLEKHVKFTKFIQPLCLPKAAEQRINSFEKSFPYVAGWGSVEFKGPTVTRLQEIQIPVVKNDECQSAYAPVGGQITTRQLCAGVEEGGQDACQGDSGGPLMWPKFGTYYLIGVVSYGYKCAEPGYPGVYARTTAYLDWINRNLL